MLSLGSWLMGRSTEVPPEVPSAAIIEPGAGADGPDPDDIKEAWLVVVEDLASVRTIELGDVLQQRVRNRPKLARWDATEDMLIENPLETPENQTTAKTWAKIARPSYAQAFRLARKTSTWVPPDCDATHGSTGIWTPVAATLELGTLSSVRSAAEARYGAGKGDSHTWCADSRIVKRMGSRVFRTSTKGSGMTKPKLKVIKPRNRNAGTRPL